MFVCTRHFQSINVYSVSKFILVSDIRQCLSNIMERWRGFYNNLAASSRWRYFRLNFRKTLTFRIDEAKVSGDILDPLSYITFRYLNICLSKLVGERKSKNLWSGCEILANFSYNFHSELWTFGAFIRGSLNKKDPKSGKVTTAGTAKLMSMWNVLFS